MAVRPSACTRQVRLPGGLLPSSALWCCCSCSSRSGKNKRSFLPAVLAVLTVTFPFFALVLCGYVATQARVLPLTAISGLNSFVLFFALPCMLFRFGASTPIGQLLDP
ncbi:MAG: AEC family transporter, partial [Comamonas sp.]|nr:AEC family transporter [Comamonas sp.]